MVNPTTTAPAITATPPTAPPTTAGTLFFIVSVIVLITALVVLVVGADAGTSTVGTGVGGIGPAGIYTKVGTGELTIVTTGVGAGRTGPEDGRNSPGTLAIG